MMESNYGMPQMEMVKECSNCKKQVSAASKDGDKCPHCGVRWGSYSSGGFRGGGRGLGRLIGLGIAVVIGIVGFIVRSINS